MVQGSTEISHFSSGQLPSVDVDKHHDESPRKAISSLRARRVCKEVIVSVRGHLQPMWICKYFFYYSIITVNRINYVYFSLFIGLIALIHVITKKSAQCSERRYFSGTGTLISPTRSDSSNCGTAIILWISPIHLKILRNIMKTLKYCLQVL